MINLTPKVVELEVEVWRAAVEGRSSSPCDSLLVDSSRSSVVGSFGPSVDAMGRSVRLVAVPNLNNCRGGDVEKVVARRELLVFPRLPLLELLLRLPMLLLLCC